VLKIRESLARLAVPQLYGLLLHDETMIDRLNSDLGELLFFLKDQELVKFVGVSVYDPARAVAAIQHECIDMVQIPSSIVDQRFLSKGIFELAREYGKKIFVRSVFLQGLLMMQEQMLPAKMQFTVSVLRKYSALAEKAQKTKQQLALGFARRSFSGAYVLFGADSAVQVGENVASWRTDLNDEIINNAFELFADVDEKILNPSLWPVT